MTTRNRLFTLLLAQALCLGVAAGNIAKKYKTHLTPEGTVYFIMPQKMAKAEGSKAQKDLLFDVTTLLTGDSVGIAATVHCEQPLTDSIATITRADGQQLTAATEYIYRELGKKGYVNRVRFVLSIADFRQLFSATAPFLLDYGRNCRFAFPNGKWANEQKLVISILDLIELNH